MTGDEPSIARAVYKSGVILTHVIAGCVGFALGTATAVVTARGLGVPYGFQVWAVGAIAGIVVLFGSLIEEPVEEGGLEGSE